MCYISGFDIIKQFFSATQRSLCVSRYTAGIMIRTIIESNIIDIYKIESWMKIP